MMYIWLAIVILLIVVEIMTVDLTTIWFVTSALISLILTFFIKSFAIQVIVFLILGVILLITTRSTLVKLITNIRHKKDVNYLVGMRGQVISLVSQDQIGEVKIDGKIWLAYADELIDINTYVTVVEINENKIKVSKDD